MSKQKRKRKREEGAMRDDLLMMLVAAKMNADAQKTFQLEAEAQWRRLRSREQYRA